MKTIEQHLQDLFVGENIKVSHRLGGVEGKCLGFDIPEPNLCLMNIEGFGNVFTKLDDKGRFFEILE